MTTTDPRSWRGVALGAAGAALVALPMACANPPKSNPESGKNTAPAQVDLHGCSRNDECAAVTSLSCCGCPDGVYAVNQSRWRSHMDQCMKQGCEVSVSCATLPQNENRPLPPATCRAGRCEIVPPASMN